MPDSRLHLAAGAPGQAPRAEIMIGFANPLSGPFSQSGERNRIAVEMAIEDLNAWRRAGPKGDARRGRRRLRDAQGCGRSAGSGRCRRRLRGRAPVLPFLAARGRRLRDRGRPDDHALLHPPAPDRGGSPGTCSADRTRRRSGRPAGDFLADRFGHRRLAILHDGDLWRRPCPAGAQPSARRAGGPGTIATRPPRRIKHGPAAAAPGGAHRGTVHRGLRD